MSQPASSGFSTAFAATLRAIFTDRAVVTVMIGAVILYSFFYPLGYRQQVASELPIVVVDYDQSSLSRQLIRAVDGVSAVHRLTTLSSEAEAQAIVASAKAEGILVISAGFERAILRGEQGKVALMGNGAYLGRANTVLTGMGDAITAFARDNLPVPVCNPRCNWCSARCSIPARVMAARWFTS